VIGVTRLGGGPLMVNADLIVSIEETPDTLVTLTNGDTLLVREAPEELVARIVRYRRRIAASSGPGDEGTDTHVS
jgi:flagellar protein FlbD